MDGATPRRASFLLRFWQEPRESPDSEPVLRCYMRNLQTGEERYVGASELLGESDLLGAQQLWAESDDGDSD